VHIRVHRQIQVLLGEFFQACRVHLERRIVDEDVELAEGFQRAADRVFAELRIAHVAFDQDALAAFALDVLLRLLRVVLFAQIHDRDLRAFACKQHGDGTADTRIAAGDQRDLVLELVAASVGAGEEARRGFQLMFETGLALMLLGQRILRLANVSGLNGAGLRRLALRARAFAFVNLPLHAPLRAD